MRVCMFFFPFIFTLAIFQVAFGKVEINLPTWQWTHSFAQRHIEIASFRFRRGRLLSFFFPSLVFPQQ